MYKIEQINVQIGIVDAGWMQKTLPDHKWVKIWQKWVSNEESILGRFYHFRSKGDRILVNAIVCVVVPEIKEQTLLLKKDQIFYRWRCKSCLTENHC